LLKENIVDITKGHLCTRLRINGAHAPIKKRIDSNYDEYRHQSGSNIFFDFYEPCYSFPFIRCVIDNPVPFFTLFVKEINKKEK
jgi:hypothetical protein